MRFDLPTVQAMVQHYARVQGLSRRTFQVQIVPNLENEGQPAWATVADAGPSEPVIVSVRDLVNTPVDGFTGDLWTELKVTVSHELWHLWVNLLLAAPTVDNEEAFVEAAAQAVVRSEGIDARVMARSSEAIPAAVLAHVRARVVKISARASVRARGGRMDPETIKALIAAIKAQDGEGALAICEKALLDQAAAGGPGGGAPPGDPAGAPAGPDMRPAPPMAGGAPKDDKAPDSEAARALARKARTAMQDEEKTIRARLTAATNEAEASAGILRTTTLRARIHEAREVDKVTISAEAEKLILAAPSIADGEVRLTLARGSAATTKQRARAVDPKTGEPVESAPVESVEAVNLEGLSPMDVQLFQSLGGTKSSAARQYVKQAQVIRARTAQAAKEHAS